MFSFESSFIWYITWPTYSIFYIIPWQLLDWLYVGYVFQQWWNANYQAINEGSDKFDFYCHSWIRDQNLLYVGALLQMHTFNFLPLILKNCYFIFKLYSFLIWLVHLHWSYWVMFLLVFSLLLRLLKVDFYSILSPNSNTILVEFLANL